MITTKNLSDGSSVFAVEITSDDGKHVVSFACKDSATAVALELTIKQSSIKTSVEEIS